MPHGENIDLETVLAMSREAAIEFLNSSFHQACLALFSGGDCIIRSVQPDVMDFSEMPVACVDGGTENLEVMLTLNMPFTALAMTYPVQNVAHTSEEELEDWISELVNRLLGKFNEYLAGAGHYLKVGLPQHQVGSEFIHEPSETGHLLCHYFDIDGEILCASLCIELFDENLNTQLNNYNPIEVNGGELELF